MNKVLTLILLICFSSGFGQEYFQQDVAYTIDVTLDDENHFLNGDISIEYTNNSNQALNFIWMHLWPNAYKDGKSALAKQQYRSGDLFMFYAISKELGYIDSLNFKVNNSFCNWEYHPDHIDIAKLNLDKPVQPGETISISTPFKVKLPTGKISRLGHIGQSYQITQWYPKPAVFDNEGWHEMPYLNQGEFYSEFGTFDVSITLPKNYVVGHTGDLVDGKEEMAFLDSLASVNIDFEIPGEMDFPPSSSQMKTLKLHQENVHDFAWFADKRWHVRKGSVKLPHSERSVTSWAMFTPRNRALWKRGVEYINDATHYYSLWNGDYPYNHVTAVDGTISAGGGMEYPNVTIIGNSNTDMMLETVIVHEVGHNWFYGILGSNERVNAWMDEGINSFNETRYFETKYTDSLDLMGINNSKPLMEKLDLKGYSYRYRDELAYLLSARGATDQPLQCHSDDFASINYGTIVYKKTAVVFDYLRGYLGDEKFDGAMQAYYDKWKFKHPAPNDLQKVLEQETGEDLSWLFNELVQTTEKPNYSVKGIKKSGDELIVKVKNTGGVPGPFELSGMKNDQSVSSTWFKGINAGESTQVRIPFADAEKVVLDGSETMLEYNRKNNSIKTSGLFKKMEPLQIRMLSRLEDPDHTQLFINPVAAWNEQNKWMLGLNIHNSTLPLRDFEFSFTPMWSFATETLTGFGRLSHHSGASERHLTFQSFRSAENNARAIDYYKIAFETTYKFNEVPNSKWKSELNVEIPVIIDNPTYNSDYIALIDSPLWLRNENRELVSPLVSFAATKSNPRLKERFTATAIGFIEGDDPFELTIQGKYEGSFRYNKKGKKISWKAFAGLTDSKNSFFGTGISSGTPVTNDPRYDHLFLQRGGSNDFLSRQVTNTQGTIRVPFSADHYMTSVLVDYELPIGLPIFLFAGGAVYHNSALVANSIGEEGVQQEYSAGVSLYFGRGLFAVHLPLATTRLFETSKSYQPFELLTFEFNINSMSPWKLARNLDLN